MSKAAVVWLVHLAQPPQAAAASLQQQEGSRSDRPRPFQQLGSARAAVADYLRARQRHIHLDSTSARAR